MGGNGNLRNLARKIPFMGETMTCLMCGKTEKSTAGIKTNWRVVVTQIEQIGRMFYACPAEFPVDAGASDEFKAAYERFLAKVIMTLRGSD